MKLVRIIHVAAAVLVIAALVAPLARAQGDHAKLEQILKQAQQAYDQKKLEQAEQMLNDERALVHADYRAILLRARVNYDLAAYGKAETFAARAAELDKGSLDAHMLRGKALYAQAEALKADNLNSGTRINGFYEAALGEFDLAANIKPDLADIPAWRAECLFWLDRVPEALAIWEAFHKQKPDDPEPLLRIAQIHQKMQNEDGALKAACDGLVTKGASSLRGDLAVIVFAIQNKRGKAAEMFATFKAWAAAHPDDPVAYLWMGYTRFLEKNFDEAIQHYTKGFDASGKKHAGLALELGNALVQRGQKEDLAKAAEAYGFAAKLQASWPSYQNGPVWKLNEIARVYIDKGDFAKATETLEKHALPAGLADRYTMNNLGLYFRDWADRGGRKGAEAKAKNEKSLEYYLKAAKLVMEDESVPPKERAQVLNDTGVIYDYNLGQMEKGLEWYRKAVQADPTLGDALENLGLCFNKLGKFDEAVPLFQKVLEAEPGRRKSQNGLAEAKKGAEKEQKPASR